MKTTITPAMRRELRSIAATGEPTDPIEWHGANGLWFHARDRVIGALKRRELITDDLKITSEGIYVACADGTISAKDYADGGDFEYHPED